MPTEQTQLCGCQPWVRGHAVSEEPELENGTVRLEGREMEQGIQAAQRVVFLSTVDLMFDDDLLRLLSCDISTTMVCVGTSMHPLRSHNSLTAQQHISQRLHQ